ncbi:hypothetical protein B0H11DRAFT_2106507 [Mycena galericulata]|nr:hypothetical protein B0H11DRAFT_2106507 [Mycena galericulata]
MHPNINFIPSVVNTPVPGQPMAPRFRGRSGPSGTGARATLIHEPPVPLYVLRRHARQARQTPITTLEQWRCYYRSYCAAVGAMYDPQRLSTADHQRYFWKGIHADLKTDLTVRLRFMQPKHDAATPWAIEDVCTAVWLHSKRNLRSSHTSPSHGAGIKLTDSKDDSESEGSDSDSEDEELN